MIIQGIPSGDINGGSSRMRYFRRKRFMPEDIEWKDYARPLDCDVLFVQKRVASIDVILEAKSKGIPVVYDTDDGNGIRRKGDDTHIFPLVDVITTDSEQRASEFRKITDTPVRVVPDGIDYLNERPDIVGIGKTIKRVCTFGSYRSVHATTEYVSKLKGMYRLTYITKKKIKELRGIKFKPWSYKKFIPLFRKYDLCIIAHENTEEKQWKGNARLLVAMSVGIPVIASDAPSYVDAMKACGMERFVVSSPDEILEKIELLRKKKTRREIQKTFMEYAWENHHPKTFALMLANIFKEVASGKISRQP